MNVVDEWQSTEEYLNYQNQGAIVVGAPLGLPHDLGDLPINRNKFHVLVPHRLSKQDKSNKFKKPTNKSLILKCIQEIIAPSQTRGKSRWHVRYHILQEKIKDTIKTCVDRTDAFFD